MKRDYCLNQIKELYISKFHGQPRICPLSADGSPRIYCRLISDAGKSYIGTYGEDVAENKVFVKLAECFHKENVQVPEIYVVSDDYTVYIQEDLGDTSLFSLLTGPDRMEFSKKALQSLIDIQTIDEKKWLHIVNGSVFSSRQILWDLSYFKYCFLKPVGIHFDENALQDDFEALTSNISNRDPLLDGFMYRDFQSRNIMVKDGDLFLIDFQGGRKGNLIYDVVSFLWQARAGFTHEERGVLIKHYTTLLSEKRGIVADKIIDQIPLMAILRTLQVLGAYGFRGLIEKKAQFVTSFPGAINNLRQLIDEGILDSYPELKRVSIQAINSRFAKIEDSSHLTLTITSFSFKKGYPEDLSGNGGGFVFDCRALPNPGRYHEYKSVTGRDESVIDFFRDKPEMEYFLENVFNIISQSVEEYETRKFTSLQVAFGCTGGQHRSVYAAERLAQKMHQLYPKLKIAINHREQGIEYNFNMEKQQWK